MKTGIYTHNKTGGKYTVKGIVIDCTNERDGTRCVLYHHYLDDPITKVFVREIEEFKKNFTFNRAY